MCFTARVATENGEGEKHPFLVAGMQGARLCSPIVGMHPPADITQQADGVAHAAFRCAFFGEKSFRPLVQFGDAIRIPGGAIVDVVRSTEEGILIPAPLPQTRVGEPFAQAVPGEDDVTRRGRRQQANHHQRCERQQIKPPVRNTPDARERFATLA